MPLAREHRQVDYADTAAAAAHKTTTDTATTRKRGSADALSSHRRKLSRHRTNLLPDPIPDARPASWHEHGVHLVSYNSTNSTLV